MRRRIGPLATLLCVVTLLVAPHGTVAATPKFLTLPFPSPAHIHIQRGWWTIGSRPGVFDLLHHGIDYIDGTLDSPPSWKSFPVYAAAAGEACGALVGHHGCFDNSTEVMGSRVLIRHVVNGQTYFTWYNHLKSIVPSIPLGSRTNTVHVKRGELIGFAGASGNAPVLIHLHFELQDANNKPIDPYGLYTSSRAYPDPAGKNSNLAGAKSYWISNPPTVPGGTPAQSPKPSPKSSTAPAGESPAPTAPSASAEPGGAGSSAAPATPGPVGQTAGPTTAAPTPVATTAGAIPTGGSSGDPPGGSGLLIPALLVAAVAAAVVAVVVLMRRRRRDVLRPGDWPH